MSSSKDLPPHTLELINRSTSLNGLHIFNPTKSAITSSCTPLLKSIQLAKIRLKITGGNKGGFEALGGNVTYVLFYFLILLNGIPYKTYT